jgi:hypothetical protein
MVDYLTAALAERGVVVEKFELSTTDIGKLAWRGGRGDDRDRHADGACRAAPSVFNATHLANALARSSSMPASSVRTVGHQSR